MYMYVWRRGKCRGKQSTPKQFSLSAYQLVATKRILWHSLVVKWQLPDNLNKVPPGKELVVTAGQECIIIIVKSAGASMASTAVEELLLTQEELNQTAPSCKACSCQWV